MSAMRVAIGGIILALSVARAEAQELRYPIQNMNFDLWCQEQKHLPASRCDQRLPADDAEFQAYRATIERYEIPYLQQRQNEQTLNRTILHSDPVDDPMVPGQPEQPADQQPSPH